MLKSELHGVDMGMYPTLTLGPIQPLYLGMDISDQQMPNK